MGKYSYTDKDLSKELKTAGKILIALAAIGVVSQLYFVLTAGASIFSNPYTFLLVIFSVLGAFFYIAGNKK